MPAVGMDWMFFVGGIDARSGIPVFGSVLS